MTEVGRIKAEINGTEYELTDHAQLRYAMRINADQQFTSHLVEEGVPVSLRGGYQEGIWNAEVGAVFLIAADGLVVSTTIPDTGLGLHTEELKECSCGFLVQEERNKGFQCNHCGEEIESESGAEYGDYRDGDRGVA